MPTKVKFDQWFRSQFGKRPSRRTESELQMVVVSARIALSNAEDTFGGYVTTVEVPPFQRWPEIIMWGSRVFAAKPHWTHELAEGKPACYREVVMFVVPT